MARLARQIEMNAAEEAVQQASFDFLPEEMRVRHRFGSEDAADWAEQRARLKVIDRQIISTGSRLAAARLREILRPVERNTAVEPSTEPAKNVTDMDRLATQRSELRELGATLFYFRNQPPVCAQDEGIGQQRIHPRPLPARYFN